MDRSLTRWVLVFMGGLWALLALGALVTGRTGVGLALLGVAGLYALALVALELRPRALARVPQTGPSTLSR